MDPVTFNLARGLASVRIAGDLVHSLVRPVCRPVGAAPGVRLETGRARPGRSPRTGLRIVSWNVHRGYRARPLLRSLERVVGEERPDLLLLQETPVYDDSPLWRAPGFGELFAEADLAFAPMHRVAHTSLYYPFRESGQLSVSWLPILESEAVSLPIVSRPKLGPRHAIARVALRVVVADEPPVAVYNLHLENTTGPSGRATQSAALVAAIAARDGGRVVVAGDLNTFCGALESAPSLLRAAGFDEAGPARPAGVLPAIDRLFARQPDAAPRLTVRRLALRGSDHRPLVAEVAWLGYSR